MARAKVETVEETPTLQTISLLQLHDLIKGHSAPDKPEVGYIDELRRRHIEIERQIAESEDPIPERLLEEWFAHVRASFWKKDDTLRNVSARIVLQGERLCALRGKGIPAVSAVFKARGGNSRFVIERTLLLAIADRLVPLSEG